MTCEKRFHLGWVRLTRTGVGLRRKDQLMKSLGRSYWKHRQIDHRGSPQFAVGQGKLQPQAAHRIRRVGHIGLPSAKRKAAEHWHAPWLKDDRFRETDPVSVAFEEAGHSHALGMIAPEAGVDSVDFLETVNELCL